MTSYLPPLNNNTEIFNVGDFNYQDSYISYYTGDKRYSKLNGMNTFTQLCFFNGGIYATSIYENGINISLKYAPINNANLTGIPSCPTPDGTITNQIANTTYVNNSIANIEFPTTNLSNYMDLTSTQTCFGSKEFSTQISTPTLILNGTSVTTTISDISSNILLKANIASPVFTTQITTPKIILGSSDLQGLLNLKSTINSPSFTGVPLAPNALLTDSSTQIATTKFIKDQGYSTLSNPVFTSNIFTQQNNGYTLCLGSLMTATIVPILFNREGMGIHFDSNPARLCGIIEPAKNNPITYRNLVLCPNGASVGIGMFIPNSLYKLDVTGAINSSTNIYEGGVLLSTKYALSSNLNLKAPIASPTFTTQITTPKIILGSTDLQTILNTKISNLSIGTVSSLPYGSVPTATINNTNPLIPTLSFNIITGEKGDKGDKGDEGDTTVATAASVASGAAATAALVSAVTAATSATASATSAGTAAASASAAEESATSAALKVRHFTASDLPNKQTLNGHLNVKDTLGISTVISLNQSGDISTSNSISVNPTGSSNVFNATSDGNLTTTGRVSLDNGRIITGKNVLNLNTINIGTNLVDGANIVTIGNGLTQVVIQGTLIYASGNNFFNVSQFINQFS